MSKSVPSKILIAGADRVMPKLFFFAHLLAREDIRFRIYTHDLTPFAYKTAGDYGVEIIPAPPHRRSVRRMLTDVITFWRSINGSDYHHAELFSDYHWTASLIYLIILKIKGVDVVFWCRGELLRWKQFSLPQQVYFKIAFRLAKSIMLKEPYMRGVLERVRSYYPEKTLEIHNSIRLPEARSRARAEGVPLSLLFLNAFVPWRNVAFCVTVASELRSRNIDFRMKIVGAKNTSPILTDQEERLRYEIDRQGLGDLVTVHPFTEDPERYFIDADFFMLPAKLVFCNYALLEAMGHGVIPLISDADEHGSRIVRSGENGFSMPLSAKVWADAICQTVSSEHRESALKSAARQTVVSEYEISTMYDLYKAGAGFAETPLLRDHNSADEAA